MPTAYREEVTGELYCGECAAYLTYARGLYDGKPLTEVSMTEEYNCAGCGLVFSDDIFNPGLGEEIDDEGDDEDPV